MSDEISGFIFGVILATVGWWLFVFVPIMAGMDDSWREQIQKHGAAHYYLDSNNNRQWNWTQ